MAVEPTPETRRHLERIPESLHEEFPDLSAEAIRLEVDVIEQRLLSAATIEDYLPLLVRRFAREQLGWANGAGELVRSG